MRAAVEQRLSALWNAGVFRERPVRTREGALARQTRDYVILDDGEPAYPDGCPPDDMRDVQLSLGLDKGGAPASEKIVLGFMNQDQPNNIRNTLLLAACLCQKDKYPQVAAMLESHVAQIQDLFLYGVVVGGHRRAVRLFLSGNYEALCTVVGHKGPSATMPCLWCLRLRAPSRAQGALDAKYGTLQDVKPPPPLTVPRLYSQLLGMREALMRTRIETMSQATHLSVENIPLVAVDPRQIVRLPLHLTIGVTLRLLRLAVEAVHLERGAAAALLFALELASKLLWGVGVRPVPYHGSNFIGRLCHRIAARSGIVCQALEGFVSEELCSSYAEAWDLWRGIVPTLNRADDIPAAEQQQFTVGAERLVALLAGRYPWVNVSPKLHILLCHAGAFMARFGSLGLYAEQAIEAWHGFCKQNAARFTADTELQSCGKLVASMALASRASLATMRLRSAIRKKARPGVHNPKPGDKRLAANKRGLRHSQATLAKAEAEREAWARAQFAEAERTVLTYINRTKIGRK